MVEVFSNWMPSCRRCNHYKHSYSLEYFRSLLLTLHKRINKLYTAKVAQDYGIIQDAVAWDGVFYFEEYEEEEQRLKALADDLGDQEYLGDPLH